MNDILNRGFVRPYIEFNFANGSIDTAPPKYFLSFHQDRSVDSAASFELTLTYVPGMDGEKEATAIHQMLLASVNKPVTYTYGYVTPGGGIHLQETYYKGIFTQYTEDLNDGYLTYKIIGVGSSVENITPDCQVENYLAERKKNEYGTKVQPSKIVRDLVYVDPIIRELFKDFYIYIEHDDEDILIESINVKNGTVREVFSGTYNADGTQSPTGFAYYSHKAFTPDQAISAGLLSPTASMESLASNYSIKASHGISSQITDAEQDAYNELNMTRRMPYVCYFDNAVDSKGSSMKGSFYYVPKFNRQVTNTYYYNFGNSFIDSDVLSFNVSNDCTVAMATAAGLTKASADIDYNGNAIGTTFNQVQTTGWHKNTYNTLSGFDESAWMTAAMIAQCLNFPFEASMTVVGQTKLNKLLDKIHVVVMMNGAEHPGLTGDYVITGIEDDVSDSGYTTTFKLLRDYNGGDSQQKYVTSKRNEAAINVQNALKDDWK